MNILFLSLIDFVSLEDRNLYTDLLREFQKHGHNIYAISPVERGKNEKTYLISNESNKILKLKIGNTQKTNIIEKGISTVMIGPQLKKAITQYFPDVSFDLILYSTPPITFVEAIEYIKKRDNARTYLLLKDIFPQNAIDLGLMSKTGMKGILYKHFRKQEKRLYAVSDHIGCMSEANVQYVLKHNPEINPQIVEVCPNSIEITDKSVDDGARKQIRKKYNIPLDKKVFVYGGNLGKPQGITFFIKCLKKCTDLKEVFFLIIGSGTEYYLLQEYIEKEKPDNIRLMKWLPKEDYDNMVGTCDVGLIFLDHRFTIPNFPSRMLAYMQAKLPILAATDPNTDIGKVIVDGGFGWWCESKHADEFKKNVESAQKADLSYIGEQSYRYMVEHYTSGHAYQIIMDKVNQ